MGQFNSSTPSLNYYQTAVAIEFVLALAACFRRDIPLLLALTALPLSLRARHACFAKNNIQGANKDWK
jgi:hypothetical protein